MKIAFILNEDGFPCGFMREPDYYRILSNDPEFEIDNKLAFVLDLEDDTPEIQNSFFNKCKKISEFWIDNFEEIGIDLDMNKLNKIMVFK